MERKHNVLWGVLALIAVFCLIFISGQTARADTYYTINGNGNSATTFYVQAWGSSTVDLTQKNGVFRYSGNTNTARAWGRFHIDIVLNGSNQRLEWEPSTGTESLTLRLYQSGYYTVTITPWTNAEIARQISGFSTWTTAPTWSVTGSSNCRLDSSSSPSGISTPTSKTAQLTVYYRDAYGNLLETHTVLCTQGSNTVTAPDYLRNGTYRRISPATSSVSLSAYGTLSPSTLTFYYVAEAVVTPTPTPTPAPTSATCMVYYRDAGGTLLQTQTVTCYRGANTITAPSTLMSGTYRLTSGSTQTVTLYTNGTLSPSSVTFYYSKVNTPTPAPVTASCRVYYRDANGSLIDSKTVTCRQGANTVTAPSSLQNGKYMLTSPATQTVTLYANGSMSPSSVTFYYNKVPDATATITVQQVDVDTGAVLSTRYETLSVGTHTVSAGSTPSGYRAYSSTTASVTVYADGTVSRGLVAFQYRKQNPVTPTPYNPPAPTPYDPPTPAANQVMPTGWDTQFGPGSKNEDGINQLYKLYDQDPYTSFSYIYWQSEYSDDIPEFTAYFNAATVSYLGMINGMTDWSTNVRYGRCSNLVVKIYSDEGTIVKTIDTNAGGTPEMKQYYLGATYHNVTKIEIFVRGIYGGQDWTKNEVRISEIAFFE